MSQTRTWKDLLGYSHTQTAVAPEKLHLTIGIYANDSYKFNWVHKDHLPDHIQYNRVYRFGRSLVVDGELAHPGYLGEQGVHEWLEKHPHVLQLPTPQFASLPYR